MSGAISLTRRNVICGAALTPVMLIAGSALATAQTTAQTTGPAPVQRPFSTRIIQSGHSLTDRIVPVLDSMVAHIGTPETRRRVIDRSTIPGSPMDWRWTHASQPDARADIGNYDLLVITERVPLSNTQPFHASEDWALRWATHAWTHGATGAGAASILYATWVHIDSGPDFDNIHNDPEAHLPFRDRLPREMARWQGILDHVNTQRPDGMPAMQMIPGPLIMAAAHDAITAGKAPGLERFDDLFSDTIHLDAAGSYLIALAHLGVIYGFDPRNLPARVAQSMGLPAETARWMEALVDDVLRHYPDAGYHSAAP